MPSLALLATLIWMQPRIQLAFWAGSAHCQLMPSFSSTSTPSSFSSGLFSINLSHISQYVLTLVIILTQVQHLALGLVKLNEVHIGAPLQPVTVPLDGISSLQHINCTIQLGDICKFAGGTLNPTVYVVD